MDMFWSVALILLVSSALNVHTSKGGDVLNREQTEEWKGWMQFMFLMYHYYSAREVPDPVFVSFVSFVAIWRMASMKSSRNQPPSKVLRIYTTPERMSRDVCDTNK